MKIYFAGSIRGGRGDADLYSAIVKHLTTHGEVLTEHVGNPNLAVNGENGVTDYHIFARDVNWLYDSHALVAEVTTPSLGVGYELGLAEHLGLDILCLYRPAEDRKLSAMVSGNQYNVIRVYQTPEVAFEHIDAFFASLKRKR